MCIGGIKERNMRRQWVVLGLILLLACITRLYRLGDVPHGLTWDEAAIGYNGYAIITTRRDEWLERLPISFRSFGDYKAPLAIYTNGIFTLLFGLSPYTVRLPFALAGVGSCFLMYLFVKECSRFCKIDDESDFLALTSASLLAISPWNIHFSRIGFEVGLSLFCSIGALWLFFFSLNRVHSVTRLPVWASTLGSVLLFTLALYAYHSAKIFVPLLLIVLLTYFARTASMTFVRKQLVIVIIAASIGSLLVYPLIKDTLLGNGATRAGVLITQQGYPLTKVLSVFTKNCIAHLRPSFLFPSVPDTYRHSAGYGVIYGTFLIAISSCIFFLLKGKVPSSYRKLVLLACIIGISGIVPAALAEEAPHENRAHLAVIGVVLAEAVAVAITRMNIKNVIVRKSTLGLYITLTIFSFVSFLNHYFTVFASQSAADFQDGYIEAFQEAVKYEKGVDGKPKVNNILFSSEYGQPYIFALFVRKTNPIWYRGGSLNTYLFTNSFSESDLSRENTLLVVTPRDLLKGKEPVYTVKGSDGSARFLFYYTN